MTISDGTVSHADTLCISQLTQVDALALDLPLIQCHSPLLTQLLLPSNVTRAGFAPERTGTANKSWLGNMVSPPGG